MKGLILKWPTTPFRNYDIYCENGKDQLLDLINYVLWRNIEKAILTGEINYDI